jgi:3,4-dihydroxy 2-butanone 4-phosphate synthase/GTP cyclohydrolase II
MTGQVANIQDAIDDIRRGRMVILVDDEDRENEGDLIMAASKVRPEDINFMARQARGLICLGLTRERCKRLGIGPMVTRNTARMSTNFTVSIEAAEGVTTGISAYDRAHTIRTAVAPDAVADHIVQPGHIFPLMAQPGGVLSRAGHTEAAVDLALLAGLEPAGVLVEVMSEDGSMARTPELLEFARVHGLKIGTIDALISHRLRTEQTVQRVAEQAVQTAHGPFKLIVYRDLPSREQHYALVCGEPGPERPALVRVQVKNWWNDVLSIEQPAFGSSLRQAMAAVAAAGEGVVVVLGQRADDDRLLDQLRVASEQQSSSVERDGDDTESAAQTWRESGIGAQILRDLGLRRLQVLGTPRRFTGLSGFGLEICGYRPVGRHQD